MRPFAVASRLTANADLGLDALQTSIRFLPLGVTAFLVNMIIPHLLGPLGPNILLLISWLLAIAGVTLFAFVDSIDMYWRLCFPGMILYIAGVGTVYYVTMVVVVTSSPAADQGSVAGIFNVSIFSISRYESRPYWKSAIREQS